MPGVGDEFRAAREARRLSLSDVAEQIHIRPLYLQGIEDDDWAVVGAEVYVRGFMRTYARFLGLDAERAISRYNELCAPGGPAARPVRPRQTTPAALLPAASGERPAPNRTVWLWAAVAAAVVFFIGYSAYVLISGNAGSPDTVPTAAPGAEPTIAPAGLKDQKQTLIIRFIEPSWASVSIDGSQQLAQSGKTGSEYVFHGKRATVRFSNGAGVEVTVNGRDLGSFGDEGVVTEHTFDLGS